MTVSQLIQDLEMKIESGEIDANSPVYVEDSPGESENITFISVEKNYCEVRYVVISHEGTIR